MGVLVETPEPATPPSEHMLECGEGLVLEWNPFRKEGYSLQMAWPDRGVHSAEEASVCSACHPMTAGGIGHGQALYPAGVAEKALKGGSDCAVACHTWLSEDLQPGVLLMGSTDGHGRVFREGYTRRKGSAAVRFARIKPGCGGCHNARTSRHGAMLGCVDCHDFAYGKSSGLHARHTKISGACASCHAAEKGGETGPFRTACYNCHASGHAP